MRFLQLLLEILLRIQSALSLPLSVFGAFGTAYPISEKTPYIFGQARLSGKRLYLAPAELCACEVAAVYNALIFLGRPRGFDEVKQAYFRLGALALWPFGFFGGNPFSIKRVLKRFGVEAKSVSEKSLSEDGCYIVSFWNGAKKLSLHTVFVTVCGGEKRAYNLFGRDAAPRRFEPASRHGLYIRCVRIFESLKY